MGFQSRTLTALAALVAVTAAAPVWAQAARVALGDVISVETVALQIAFERAKDRGVAYQLTSFSKEDLAIQAVINNQADIGIGTPYAVMQKTKAPLKAVFQTSRLVFFPVVDKAAYKTWKDVNGQPFTFHARGSGTEAIGNIIARRQGIQFGERSYIAGSENRVIAMLRGQIKATIIDLANKNKLMEQAPDRFAVLPSVDTPASDELLFVRVDWQEKNRDKLNIIVEEFLRTWREMAKDPAMVDEERKKRNLLADLPKEALADVTKFYTVGLKEGLFDPTGGFAAARSDFEFYVEAGQLQGPADTLNVSDFWDLGPLTAARGKLGS
mgnify:CR=1 FL=1